MLHIPEFQDFQRIILDVEIHTYLEDSKFHKYSRRLQPWGKLKIMDWGGEFILSFLPHYFGWAKAIYQLPSCEAGCLYALFSNFQTRELSIG